MLQLIKDRNFPTWALFAYTPLKKAAGDRPPPSRLALISQSEDAIMLAPTKRMGGWVGFFICQREAAGRVHTFLDTKDQVTIQLEVPRRFGAEATMAEEAVVLTTASDPA